MGPEFWESLKHSSLEAEVKPLYADAKNVLYGKRGGPVLQVVLLYYHHPALMQHVCAAWSQICIRVTSCKQAAILRDLNPSHFPDENTVSTYIAHLSCMQRHSGKKHEKNARLYSPYRVMPWPHPWHSLCWSVSCISSRLLYLVLIWFGHFWVQPKAIRASIAISNKNDKYETLSRCIFSIVSLKTRSPIILAYQPSSRLRIDTIAKAKISESRIIKGVSLQVEADLQLARLLAGLHSHQARREVSERASQIQEAGVQLLLPEDRLYAMMEAAQVKYCSQVYTLSSLRASLQTYRGHNVWEWHSPLLGMGAVDKFIWSSCSSIIYLRYRPPAFVDKQTMSSWHTIWSHLW